MNLEQALNVWLTTLTGLDCYWLERPEKADTALVYRCLSPGKVDGNLRQTGIKADRYSLTIYHHSPDEGKRLVDKLVSKFDGFNGDLVGYPIQQVSLSGGFDQPLIGDPGKRLYQFNRDFLINH
ncbi:hypothetical protein [Vibrio parahaemolyticus]|uniref:hypothetical protein n=1 Tax=Vibrio parahaemolyticus TaxID=670 RepID=UPI00146A8EBB|nr:hypothetical protein [Vibrio parahaemolyticus]MDF4554908.1 hypothetical protein [Vibrio parahaemolyticus]MDF5352803.1 hypothetical protein [Vibrio parahaemolyticus]MDF5368254.1 hypothetical protein [Vibrio parahaemolyticus]MDG2771236.1 hypothetical protein [Vibrio parahaemolyticus]MDG2826666.1 hypothetical protein [Vibrio parahaemolyticus]